MDPLFYPHDRELSPRLKANIFSIFTFWWLKNVFVKGYRRPLGLSDIYAPIDDHRSSTIGDRYEKLWNQQLMEDKPSLFKVMYKVHGTRLMIYHFLFGVTECGLRLALPICLGQLLSYWSSDENSISKTEAFWYAGGVVASLSINILIFHPYLTSLLHIAMKIRLGCCSLINRKVLKLDLRAPTIDGSGLTGKVINLIANDTNRFDMCVVFWSAFLRGPTESAAAIYIMYRYVGPASLIGVGFLLCFIPLQVGLGNWAANLRKKAAEETDNRIRLMGEVIRGIQLIKMYTWEYCFAEIVKKARKKEMFIIRKISWIKSIILCCVRLNTKISVFISILAYLLFENQLTAPKVFMLLSLYDLLKTNLVEFLPMSIMFLLEAKVSIHRIQEFLLLPEVDKYRLENSFLENDLHNQKITIGNSIANATGFENNTEEIICDVEPPKMALVMKNVSAFWKNLDPTDSNYKIALQNISLEVSSGELLTIIGLVGSGKSSILHAILGEIKTDPGSSIRLSGPVSYSSQIPWAFEASIQQNILMGEEMNRKRYKEVIKCCQLEKDLSSWKHGDRTIVGERGVSLSGGQRTRLSLARCVYREAHLYLLDDPLSSVDACVARELFDKCLRGLLKESAVVLVTHQLNLLKGTDQICLMQEGKMLFKGLFEDLQSSSSRFSQFLQDNTKPNRETNRDAYKQHHTEDTHLLDDSKISEGSTEDLTSSTECLIHPPEEAQQIGAVKASVYSKYFKSGANSFGLLLLAMLFSLGQASFSISDLWISHWVDLEERNNTYGIQYHTNISSELHIPAQISYNLYNQVFILIDLWSFSRRQCIYIYAGLISTSILLILTELLIFFNITTKSSITLHDSMFRGLLRTTMKFFNQTTSGKILNRVSKDMGTTDSVLPAAIVDCIGFFLEIVGILIVVCIVNVWLLIPTALLVIILAIMRGVFISTSRSLKRLEAICRSPAFTHVSATLEGLDTIRASNLRGQLTAEFDCHLDLHSSAWTLIINTNRGFSLWVDIFCCFYLAAITFSFLLFFEDATYGSSVGLAVTQVMALIDKCQWGLKQAAEMENQMTSIERIAEYSNLDSEPALNTDEDIFKFKYPNINLDRWPQKGTLLFKEINLKYDENNYVLQNINFDVHNREKVGIIGRTGAGKSSIISALFRLTDTEGIIEIDGVDTKDVGLHKLRSSMSIIPQEPFIFNGSLRQNLDPRNEYSDENLWNSLDEVELKFLVSNLSGGLDAIISDSGSNLSVGERQLLSLARASLRKSHFLIMDEATANVDPETDQLIQQTIRRKFSDKTVLTIAHRLHTVIKSDKMIVMDRGRIVELGHPYELIANSNQQKSPHSSKYTQNNKSNTSLFYNEKQKQNKNSNHSIFNSLLNEQSTNDLLYKIAEENYSTKESQQSTGKINELKM